MALGRFPLSTKVSGWAAGFFGFPPRRRRRELLDLYHNDMSSCAQKVRLTLAEKGLEWRGYHMNLRAGETRTDEYTMAQGVSKVK